MDIKTSSLYELIVYTLKVKNNTATAFTIMVSPSLDWKDYPTFMVSDTLQQDWDLCLNQSYPKTASEPFNYEAIEIAPDSTYLIKGIIYPVMDIKGKYTVLSSEHSYYIKSVVRVNEGINYYSNAMKFTVHNPTNDIDRQALKWLGALSAPYYFLEVLNLYNTKVLHSTSHKAHPDNLYLNSALYGLDLPTKEYDDYILEHFPKSRYAQWATLHKAFVLVYRDYYQLKEVDNDWYNKSIESLNYLSNLIKSNDEIILRCTQKVVIDLKNNFYTHKQLYKSDINSSAQTLPKQYLDLDSAIKLLEIDLARKIKELD